PGEPDPVQLTETADLPGGAARGRVDRATLSGQDRSGPEPDFDPLLTAEKRPHVGDRIRQCSGHTDLPAGGGGLPHFATHPLIMAPGSDSSGWEHREGSGFMR